MHPAAPLKMTRVFIATLLASLLAGAYGVPDCSMFNITRIKTDFLYSKNNNKNPYSKYTYDIKTEPGHAYTINKFTMGSSNWDDNHPESECLDESRLPYNGGGNVPDPSDFEAITDGLIGVYGFNEVNLAGDDASAYIVALKNHMRTCPGTIAMEVTDGASTHTLACPIDEVPCCPAPEKLFCEEYVVNLTNTPTYNAVSGRTVFEYDVSCFELPEFGEAKHAISHIDWTSEDPNWVSTDVTCYDTGGSLVLNEVESGPGPWEVGPDGQGPNAGTYANGDTIYAIKSEFGGVNCDGTVHKYTLSFEGDVSVCDGDYIVKASTLWGHCNEAGVEKTPVKVPCSCNAPSSSTSASTAASSPTSASTAASSPTSASTAASSPTSASTAASPSSASTAAPPATTAPAPATPAPSPGPGSPPTCADLTISLLDRNRYGTGSSAYTKYRYNVSAVDGDGPFNITNFTISDSTWGPTDQQSRCLVLMPGGSGVDESDFDSIGADNHFGVYGINEDGDALEVGTGEAYLVLLRGTLETCDGLIHIHAVNENDGSVADLECAAQVPCCPEDPFDCADYTVDLLDSMYNPSENITYFEYNVSCQPVTVSGTSNAFKDISHWNLAIQDWNQTYLDGCFEIDLAKSISPDNSKWDIGQDRSSQWPNFDDIYGIKFDGGPDCNTAYGNNNLQDSFQTYTLALKGNVGVCDGDYIIKAGGGGNSGGGNAFCPGKVPCCDPPATTPAPSTTTTTTYTCPANFVKVVIDFENLEVNSTPPNDQFCSNAGLTVSSGLSLGATACVGLQTNGSNAGPNIFDAACGDGTDKNNCTGGDDDLFQPQEGNVLILQNDGSSGGATSVPNDDASGGCFIFNMDALIQDAGVSSVFVAVVTLLDVEENNPATINALLENGTILDTQSDTISDLLDGNIQYVPLNWEDVKVLTICLPGISGAIGDIGLCLEPQTSTTSTSTSTSSSSSSSSSSSTSSSSSSSSSTSSSSSSSSSTSSSSSSSSSTSSSSSSSSSTSSSSSSSSSTSSSSSSSSSTSSSSSSSSSTSSSSSSSSSTSSSSSSSSSTSSSSSSSSSTSSSSSSSSSTSSSSSSSSSTSSSSSSSSSTSSSSSSSSSTSSSSSSSSSTSSSSSSSSSTSSSSSSSSSTSSSSSSSSSTSSSSSSSSSTSSSSSSSSSTSSSSSSSSSTSSSSSSSSSTSSSSSSSSSTSSSSSSSSSTSSSSSSSSSTSSSSSSSSSTSSSSSSSSSTSSSSSSSSSTSSSSSSSSSTSSSSSSSSSTSSSSSSSSSTSSSSSSSSSTSSSSSSSSSTSSSSSSSSSTSSSASSTTSTTTSTTVTGSTSTSTTTSTDGDDFGFDNRGTDSSSTSTSTSTSTVTTETTTPSCICEEPDKASWCGPGRYNCHGDRWNQSQCEAAGCCYHEEYSEYLDASVPMCFKPKEWPICAQVELEHRLECGPEDITRDACEEKGCCWGPNNESAPVCFFGPQYWRPFAPKLCPKQSRVRVEAGYDGIDKKECESRGACWDEDYYFQEEDAPEAQHSCYLPAPRRECRKINVTDRVQCKATERLGRNVTSAHECLSCGCCVRREEEEEGPECFEPQDPSDEEDPEWNDEYEYPGSVTGRFITNTPMSVYTNYMCPTQPEVTKTETLTCEQYQLAKSKIVDQFNSIEEKCAYGKCRRADFAGCILRLAGHDFMDYYEGILTESPPGGSDGCIDLDDPDNKGLEDCLLDDEPEFPNFSLLKAWRTTGGLTHAPCEFMSFADWVVLAAEVVMELTRPPNGAPLFTNSNGKRTFVYGRQTQSVCYSSEVNKMPNPEKGCQENDRVFIKNLELTVEETVAIMGVHSLGRCRYENSGFDGGWEASLDTKIFDTTYYKSMITNGWIREQTPPPFSKTQWRRSDGGANTYKKGSGFTGPGYQNLWKEIMLDTDLCLAYSELVTYDDETDINGDYSSMPLKTREQGKEKCDCAWKSPIFSKNLPPNKKKFAVADVVNNSADRMFCGWPLEDVPFTFNEDKRICCAPYNYDEHELALARSMNEIRDCGGNPTITPGVGGPAEGRAGWSEQSAEAVFEFAQDDAAWVETFTSAWRKATSRGHPSLYEVEVPEYCQTPVECDGEYTGTTVGAPKYAFLQNSSNSGARVFEFCVPVNLTWVQVSTCFSDTDFDTHMYFEKDNGLLQSEEDGCNPPDPQNANQVRRSARSWFRQTVPDVLEGECFDIFLSGTEGSGLANEGSFKMAIRCRFDNNTRVGSAPRR